MEQINVTIQTEKGRIDKVLSEHLPNHSRSQIQQWLKEKHVTVNGETVRANYKVTAGDEIVVTIPEPEVLDMVAEDIPLTIVYEDNDVIVVNKPQGMVVHPSAGHPKGTLVNALLHHADHLSAINDVVRPGIVHRIDKDTSGLLMVAKNDQAHESLAKQLKEKTSLRKYVALVHGVIPHDKGEINAPIGRSKVDRKMQAVIEGGKEALAMRLPNPRMVAIDFLYGTIAALPIGALYFLVIIPSTQQSMLLLCISLAVMAFFIGIEVQKRRLGSLGALASTINIIVLDNPMTFHFSQFLDSALGQLVGCFLAMMVILLVRDNSQARTGRVLLNQFVSAAVSSMTTNTARRKENHLPALYQQLFLLLNKFPGDVARFRLALTMIIAHQRLRNAPVPINDDLSAFHRQLRRTADHVISASSDDKRRRYFKQLLEELDIYQEKLRVWEAPPQVTEPVERLVFMLHRYQNALTDS